MTHKFNHEVTRILVENGVALKQILDTLPLGVIITNREGVVIYYNQAHSNIDELDPSQVLGKLENDVLFGPDITSICLRTGRPVFGFIYPYQTFRGKEVNGAYWVYPLRLNGRVEAVICFTQPLATGEEEYKVQVQWPASTPVSTREKKMVGSSPSFKKAIHLARQAAKGPSPVLLVGATGTGKEMFARYIHQNSPRKNKPFMAVNCAAIPEALLEGLLFGTTKGSFTGAVDRAGLFEEANGGVLYLDEMDSMPMELQPKLLRVLQETCVRRLGSGDERLLDLKIISSIGTTPQAAMTNGRLRDDLYYRLSVLTINLPPLADRLDDLEELSNYFMTKYNALLDKQTLKIDEKLMKYLRLYSWPGNVRELEHFLAGAINLAADKETILTVEHIPDHYRFILADSWVDQSMSLYRPSAFKPQQPTKHLDIPAPKPKPVNQPNARPRLKSSIFNKWQDEYEQISNALEATYGHITNAALHLGISRQLLHYKMKKYGLDRCDFQPIPNTTPK